MKSKNDSRDSANAVNATDRERYSVMIGVLVYVSTIIFLSTKMGAHIICAANKDGKMICQSFGNSSASGILSEKAETNDDVEDDGVSFIHRFAAFNDSQKIEWPTSSQNWHFQPEYFGLPDMPVQNLKQSVKEELKARASRFSAHNNVDNYQRQCNVNTNNRQSSRVTQTNCKKLRKMIGESTVAVYESWTSTIYTKSVWGIECILFQNHNNNNNGIVKEKPYHTCTYNFFREYPTKDVAQLPPPQLVQLFLIGGRRVGTSTQ